MFSMELNVVFNMLIEEGEIEFITLKKDTIINVFMFVMFMSILIVLNVQIYVYIGFV